jgi:hypothetical protein
MTDPHVPNELKAREPLFHRRNIVSCENEFLAETTEDFWEIGASGTIYDRATVLDVLRVVGGSSRRWNGRSADAVLVGHDWRSQGRGASSVEWPSPTRHRWYRPGLQASLQRRHINPLLVAGTGRTIRPHCPTLSACTWCVPTDQRSAGL